MMINQNSAVHFYGRRPTLTHNLPAHHSAHDLGAISESIGKLYIPGSAGAAAIGSILDKFGTMGVEVVKQAYPGLGQALEFVGDVADFILTPMGNLVESMAVGSATYLEMAQAQAVLDDMSKNWSDYAKDAFCDFLYALHRRLGSSNNKVIDIKEGRSPVLQGIFGGILDTLGVGRNSNRVANRIYVKAMAAGAKDWQAAAAVCYGVLKGLRIPGLDLKDAKKYTSIKGVDIVNVNTGPDATKPIFPLGNDFDALYFSKLGPLTDKDRHTLAWVDKQYRAKSGGVAGDMSKDGGEIRKDTKAQPAAGGGLLPLLALGAVAFFASK